MINIVTTAPEKEILDRIGRALLEKRLVACLQILGPIRSLYWWKGRLEEADEWLGIMKTRQDLYEEVEKEIKALHPYEVPQIEAFEAWAALPAYGRWVRDETGGKRDAGKKKSTRSGSAAREAGKEKK